jgi:hypothetical protein
MNMAVFVRILKTIADRCGKQKRLPDGQPLCVYFHINF